jgi:hypothetical protein
MRFSDKQHADPNDPDAAVLQYTTSANAVSKIVSGAALQSPAPTRRNETLSGFQTSNCGMWTIHPKQANSEFDHSRNSIHRVLRIELPAQHKR